MKAFIDTSALFKKYVDEEGAEKFNKLLDEVSEIIIAPTTLLEVHSALERRSREKTLNPADAKGIEQEFLFDYDFYAVVEWNEHLQNECIRVIRKHQLKVLDAIQLSSAFIAKPNLFITSDKKLFAASKAEIGKSILI